MGLDCELGPPDPEQSAPRSSGISPIEGWFHHNFHSIPGLFDILENQMSEWNSVAFSMCVFTWNNPWPGLSGTRQLNGRCHHSCLHGNTYLTTTCGLEYLKFKEVQQYNWEVPPPSWSKKLKVLMYWRGWEAALAGEAQWIDCRPGNKRVLSSIPSHSTCLGCKQGPQ